MIIAGVLLFILGVILAVPILWVIGVIVVIIGGSLWVVGAAGREDAGRRHYR